MPGKSEKETYMSKHQERGRDGLSEQQTQNLTATSLASARNAERAAGGQEVAESSAVDAAQAANGGTEGAPPSNTAPDNCNGGEGFFKALRWGVDSLYLSYPGELSKERDAQLK